MLTVHEIVKRAGGPAYVAVQIADIKEITPAAVSAWKNQGIPRVYWERIIALAGVTRLQIDDANQILRREREARKRGAA